MKYTLKAELENYNCEITFEAVSIVDLMENFRLFLRSVGYHEKTIEGYFEGEE